LDKTSFYNKNQAQFCNTTSTIEFLQQSIVLSNIPIRTIFSQVKDIEQIKLSLQKNAYLIKQERMALKHPISGKPRIKINEERNPSSKKKYF